MRRFITPLMVLGLAAAPVGILGCEETLEEERQVDVQEDGTVIKEEEKVTEGPGGTITKTEEKQVETP